MSIESGIYTALTTDTDVAALITNGDSPETFRVYPLRLKEGYSLPAISYQRISTDRLHDLDGPTGRASPRFQIDCWAASYSTVRDLATKVRAVLDGHKGTLGGEANVGGIHQQGERDGFEEDIETYRVTMDFFIPHAE